MKIGIPRLSTTVSDNNHSVHAPNEERKHPLFCLIADVIIEVLIRYPQSTKDVKVAMFPLSRFLFIVKNWLSEYNKIVFLLSSVKNLFKSRANYKINNHLFLFPRRILTSIFLLTTDLSDNTDYQKKTFKTLFESFSTLCSCSAVVMKLVVSTLPPSSCLHHNNPDGLENFLKAKTGKTLNP